MDRTHEHGSRSHRMTELFGGRAAETSVPGRRGTHLQWIFAISDISFSLADPPAVWEIILHPSCRFKSALLEAALTESRRDGGPQKRWADRRCRHRGGRMGHSDNRSHIGPPTTDCFSLRAIRRRVCRNAVEDQRKRSEVRKVNRAVVVQIRARARGRH